MTISAGILEIEVKLKNQQLDGQLSQTHSKLAGFATKSAAQIQKAHTAAFLGISRSAIMMGRQITTVLKMAATPIIGALGKSVHSLFTSQSQAGEQARRQWAGLKSVIDENMTRIGYYVSQSKIFGKNMYEWVGTFGQMLSKVTRNDIQKLINSLQVVLGIMAAIKAATIGLKFAQGAVRASKFLGGKTDLTGEKIVAGDIAGSLIAGQTAGASASRAVNKGLGLNVRTALSGAGGYGYSGIYNVTKVTKGFPGQKLASIEPELAKKLLAMNAALLAKEKFLSGSMLSWSAAIVGTIGVVTNAIGMIHNAIKKGDLSSGTKENFKTGLTDLKELILSIVAIPQSIATYWGALTGGAGIKGAFKQMTDIAGAWMGPALDPTVWMSKEQRRAIDRKFEPSFENEQAPLDLSREDIDSIEQLMTGDAVKKYWDEQIKETQKFNTELYENWAETQKKMFEATEEYNRKKEEDDKDFMKEYGKITDEMNQYAKDIGTGSGSLGNAIFDAKGIVAEAAKQPLGYSGQKVGITELGAFSTQMQVQKQQNAAESAKKLITANEKLETAIDNNTAEQGKAKETLERLIAALVNKEEYGFSAY